MRGHRLRILIILKLFSVRPETVTIMNKKEPISAGREYHLECRSSGSRPPATITWWKNIKFQQQSTSKVTDFLDSSRLGLRLRLRISLKVMLWARLRFRLWVML